MGREGAAGQGNQDPQIEGPRSKACVEETIRCLLHAHFWHAHSESLPQWT